MVIRSILVVDDDPDVRQLFRDTLEPLGYSVSQAAGGREAVHLLDIQTVDLVITDVLMPDGDGFELITTLHKNFDGIPIIAISGGGRLSADTYLVLARGFHVDWLLKKPFNRGELLRAIKAVEDRSSASAPPCVA